jgi:transcriptional regulator with XRE-family HTH domain
MSNYKSICELLGVTQEELAMLLKVSRSQLSMYELGKRDLPVRAKLKMAAILSYTQMNKEKDGIDRFKNQEIEKRKIIEELLFLNKRKKLSLEKKLNALAKKLQTNQAAMRLVDYLKTENNNTEGLEVEIRNIIEQKIKRQNEKPLLQTHFKLQLQLEALQEAEKYFETAIKTLSAEI